MSERIPEAGDREEAELEQLRALVARLEQPGSHGLNRLVRYLPVLALGNLLFAAPAMLISVAVAYFAFEQAEATKKMQVGSVWPNIAYDTGNVSENGEPEITMSVANRGVRPARIAAMEVSYRGQPYRDMRALMRACCVREGKPARMILMNVNGEVIAPGDELDFVRLTPEMTASGPYSRFDGIRPKVRVRLCYCSVFDECWVEDSQATGSRPVAACPAGWVPFGLPAPAPAQSAV